MQVTQLLFVASVDESHKLVCQAPSCGRGIARAVHVIRDETGSIRVVGSGCFEKLAGHKRATEEGAVLPGFDGRRLTAEERSLMVADTTALIARVEARLAAERVDAERMAAELADRQREEARQEREEDAGSEAPSDRHAHGAWSHGVGREKADVRQCVTVLSIS